MMQAPVINNSCRATHALEELSRSRRSSGVEIDDRRDNGERCSSLKNKNSTCTLHDLFHSIVLISDQPYYFPAIEWCFEDGDDDTARAAEKGNGVNLDQALLSQFNEQRRSSNTERLPQLIRCAAHTNLDEILLCV